MTKFLITGASGFLGSHIAERLFRMGERNIICLDVLQPDMKLPGIHYIVQDILNLDRLLEVSKDVDIIFHTAALVPLTKAGDRFYEVNVRGTQNVVYCCRRYSVRKLVHLSSSAIYGIPKDTPITEATEYFPVEIYGRSKLEAEYIVRKYIEEGGSAACIRPRTIVGGKSRLGVFQILFEWISENCNIYVIGDGTNPFQFVHIADLLDAIIQSAFSNTSGLYNIGSKNFGTLHDTLQALIVSAGSASKIKKLPVFFTRAALGIADLLHLSPLAPWHYLTYHKPFVFDISRAVRELSWHPRFSDVDALKESYTWYMSHKDGLKRIEGSAHKKPPKQRLLKVLKWIS
ncbi:MAG: NAD-dependent epimerase/dehydratase family protein [Spirochaetales bacterium]|nr:NAD-dependent epimerase/dehydratase family protein [Spirochaetales bacterium]